MTREQVAAIVPDLPTALEKIGVFVDATVDEIAAVVRVCGLTGVQLHLRAGPESDPACATSSDPDCASCGYCTSIPGVAAQAAALAIDRNIDAILVDSRTATAVGGTGIAFDWDAAASMLFGKPQSSHSSLPPAA